MASVSKNFQDLITFSRATNGTYVNSAGYITNSTVANYLTYSNQFDNAAWTKNNAFIQTNLLLYSEQFDQWSLGAGTTVATNTTIAPNSTLTADRVSYATGGAADFLRKTATMTIGVTYTVSVYAQNTGASPTFYFDIGNGGVAASPVQTTTSTWQRFSYTFVFAGVNQWVDLEASTPGSINFWGAQLVQGAVPGDYVATTSAALPVLYPDYNGALRARKLCETAAVSSGHWASQTVTAGNGVYTLSVYAKAGERTYVYLDMSDNITGDTAVLFNLSTGTYSALGTTGSWTNASATITSIANGWYRCVLTATRNAGTATVSNVYIAQPSTNYTGDGSSGIYIVDSQLVSGAVPGPYYDTSTTLTYAQRRDFSPSTLACLGLLVEESRTNLLYYSNDFLQSPTWQYRGTASVTANATVSPDGTNNAFLIAGIGALLNDLFQQITVASGVSYTPSLWIKRVSTTGTLNVANPAGTNGQMTINMALLSNDWERITPSHPAVTVIAPFSGSATNTGGVHILNNLGGTLSFYLYGAQVELGAFATSYIPTTTSQVTRAADVASVNTLSPWFNAVAGTLYAEYDAYAPISGAAFGIAVLSDGSSSNRTYLFLGGGTAAPSLVVTSGGVAQANIGNSAISANAITKTAGAYAVNDFAIATNAGTVATDASGALAIGQNRLELGSFLLGTFLNGHIRRITYYPQRLTNAQLQSITA